MNTRKKKTEKNNQPPKRTFRKEYIPLLLMTVPGFIFVIIFSYVPIWGWSMAFVDFRPGISILDSEFVGLRHFIRLFARNDEFMMVMRNTLVLSALNLLTGPLVVVLAIMINEIGRKTLKRFLQTFTSFPNFVSWVVVYAVFFSLMSVEDGLINRALISLGFIDRGINFLGDASLAWPLQTFVTFWKGAGWSAIIYLAAIAGIDQEQYEAAQIDGANRIQQIWHITVPGILPTYFVLLMLGIGHMLSAGGFDQYFLFHNPLVHNRIEVLDTYSWRIGMRVNDFALATAAGIFKSVLSVTLLFLANKAHKLVRGYSLI